MADQPLAKPIMDEARRAAMALARRPPEDIASELSWCRPQSDPERKDGHCGYCVNCVRAKRIRYTIEWDRVGTAALAAEAHEREQKRLQGLLDRDHTGLASALNAIGDLMRGWSWLAEPGVWGSYDYTQQTEETLRAEIGRLFEQARATITTALTESGVRAQAAFQPERDRIVELERDRDEWKRLASGDLTHDEVEALLVADPKVAGFAHALRLRATRVREAVLRLKNQRDEARVDAMGKAAALEVIVSGEFDDVDPDDGMHRVSVRDVARSALAAGPPDAVLAAVRRLVENARQHASTLHMLQHDRGLLVEDCDQRGCQTTTAVVAAVVALVGRG